MPIRRRLRQQGSVVITLPSTLAELFDVRAGDEVEIHIDRRDRRYLTLDMIPRRRRAPDPLTTRRRSRSPATKCLIIINARAGTDHDGPPRTPPRR